MKKLMLLSAILLITILIAAPAALTTGKPATGPNYKATVTSAIEAFEFPIYVDRFCTLLNSEYTNVPTTVKYIEAGTNVPRTIENVPTFIAVVNKPEKKSIYPPHISASFKIGEDWYQIMAFGNVNCDNMNDITFYAPGGGRIFIDVPSLNSSGDIEVGTLAEIYWRAEPIQ